MTDYQEICKQIRTILETCPEEEGRVKAIAIYILGLECNAQMEGLDRAQWMIDQAFRNPGWGAPHPTHPDIGKELDERD